MIVYKITNKITGLSYIGQTIQKLNTRWNSHCKKSECNYLYRAIQKYGKENFSVEELATYTNLDDLNNAEEYYIDHYNTLAPNGYNLIKGGRNRTVSEITRKKLSLLNSGKRNNMYGKTHSLEARAKISASRKNLPGPNKGKKMSQEQKQKLRVYHTGLKASEETKSKMSHSQKARWAKRHI